MDIWLIISIHFIEGLGGYIISINVNKRYFIRNVIIIIIKLKLSKIIVYDWFVWEN